MPLACSTRSEVLGVKANQACTQGTASFRLRVEDASGYGIVTPGSGLNAAAAPQLSPVGTRLEAKPRQARHPQGASCRMTV